MPPSSKSKEFSLQERITAEYGRRGIAQTDIPTAITENLRIKFPLRPYQIESIQYFLRYTENGSVHGSHLESFHVLLNMATGSGKTLIMAALVLLLFSRGYRNFLFFVNSTNIILKTKENFLNPKSSKYLFNETISINGRVIKLREVKNFNESDKESINLRFSTVQQLHVDLTTTKENSISFEQFEDDKVVLIADEAHHLNASIANNAELFRSWEGTAMRILGANSHNILLEFTATIDFDDFDIAEKYRDKLLYMYDLSQFRNDKYSKEISLVRSEYSENDRILQAVIVNQYRQDLAASRNINLKPVILFKAKRTIAESQQNKINFVKLIESLGASDIRKLKDTSTLPVINEVFRFYKEKQIALSELARRIRENFKPENCLSANDDEEARDQQIRLNSLEDDDNPIRAVFAVHKLNEGWDVLNLFDIVRLYEGRDARAGRPGRTTISEAQLIGRGARYYPFVLEQSDDPFRRKFDNELTSDLRILEELYFHTRDDVRYISELKTALIESGIYEDQDELVVKSLKLKDVFKKSDFYQSGLVFSNHRIMRSYANTTSFQDLGIQTLNYDYKLPSGRSTISSAFDEHDTYRFENNQEYLVSKVSSISENLVKSAISRNPYFRFSNILRTFPRVESLSNFISNPDYLGLMTITFRGSKERLDQITNTDRLAALVGLLNLIETAIASKTGEFEGSAFEPSPFSTVFKDKDIRIPRNSPRLDGQIDVVDSANWYVFNANYGTSEEKSFVRMFENQIDNLREMFQRIYLVRNERELKIVDSFGRAFEPDFILFCLNKLESELSYQVFIEPKGDHLIDNDAWKEQFLKELRDRKQTFTVLSDSYRVTGVPFYNSLRERYFVDQLESVIKTQ